MPRIKLIEKEVCGGTPSGFFDYLGKVEDACKHLNLSPKVQNALNAGEDWVLELFLMECGRPYRQGKSPEAAAKAFVDAISRELAQRGSLTSEARRYNYGAMTKDDFVRSATYLYLKSLKRRKIDPEDGYEIEDLVDTLSDSGLYLEKWVIAHIGLPKGEAEETYDAWMDERPEVHAVIDAIMAALKEKGYSVE